MMTSALLILASMAALPAWEFDTPGNLEGWQPNAHLNGVTVGDRVAAAQSVDWDPFFTQEGLSFAATPWQYVTIRLKTDRGGMGELFWTGETQGEYGGFGQDKRTPFQVRDGGDWQEVTLFPGWHPEGTIRKLRLDLYDDAHFEIDWIRILEWGAGQEPLKEGYAWEFADGRTTAWQVSPSAPQRFAPRLDLPLDGRGWVTLEARSQVHGEGQVLWEAPGVAGVQSESFALNGDGTWHYYNIEVSSFPSWKERLSAFGVQFPESAGVEIKRIAIAEQPEGPPARVLRYLGFENGVNRAQRPVLVLAQFENTGGTAGSLGQIDLTVSEGLALTPIPPADDEKPLEFGDIGERRWELRADKAGSYDIALKWGGEPAKTTLTFLPPMELRKEAYVPAPRPVKTDLDVLMYYFPGWNNEAAWDCIRRVAPVRKPMLGYYDEAKPECVDWQIKWAAENGITAFLVDWYWVGGNQHLTHWFEAYRQARYRGDLKVAIMWANHNPPNTHTREDWRAVTREWIERYFSLDTYYRIGGKPALFLWDPSNLRRDLGGSDAVRAALAESQEMAKAAGFPGIEFVVVNTGETASQAKTLLEEGYAGDTNYHEWGKAPSMAEDPKNMQYCDVVSTIAERWRERDAFCGPLTYYPVIETGWDAWPWHGSKSQVIYGRDVKGFEEICRQAKAFAAEKGRKAVVIGPANEWGEGSYIEPNTEFGFEMYEAVRRVFAQGSPDAWPVNLGPADVGLGPYDFPVTPPKTAWNFDSDSEGWAAMMNVTDLRCENGALVFKTVTTDPALRIGIRPLWAAKYPKAQFRMRIEGPEGPTSGQLFWSVGGSASSEATSVSFPVATDGQSHEYTLELSENVRWRGRISSLRFDPCAQKDATVYLDSFAFVE